MNTTKGQRTNTYLQYDTQNIKNWATWTPQKDEKDKHVHTIWYAEYYKLSNMNTTKGQRTNTYLQYDTQNIKNWATRTPQKAKGQTRTYNMRRRILKTEQHEHYQNRVNMWTLITTICFLSTSQYWEIMLDDSSFLLLTGRETFLNNRTTQSNISALYQPCLDLNA